VSQMIAFHEQNEAECTIAGIPVPIETASSFGIIQVEEDWRVIGFEEKPKNAKPIPGDPTRALASLGNYVFSCRALLASLEQDGANTTSSHDFGKDVIPAMVQGSRVFCYDFTSNVVPGEKGPNLYWHDVGTIEAYYDANMDLRDVVPAFNLYNRHWPIRSARYDDPPAKFVHESDSRTGRALNSMVCEGSILSGCTVRNSIVGRNVKIHSFTEVSDSIILDNVEIGMNVKIHKAIIDKNVKLPDGAMVGTGTGMVDGEHFVSPTGITVIPKMPRYDTDITQIKI